MRNPFAGLHVVQRTGMPTLLSSLYRLIAVVLALVTGGLFMFAVGFDPISVYTELLRGALGTKSSTVETLKNAIPLCIAALGVGLAFKMRFWNIGAEGQICVGAIAASFIAYTFSDLPMAVMLPLMALASIVGAGVWGLIPAYFKTRFGTNETLFTLMMNYVAAFFIQYLREGPWRAPDGFPKTPMIVKAGRLPQVFGLHIGWIAALLLVVLLFLYLRYTKQGYELTVVGENPTTARYAGMPVSKIVMRTMFLSAAIAGLAGMIKLSGADKRLTDTVAGGLGFTAITVAWLGKLNPFAIAVIAVLFGILSKGCSSIESTLGVSISLSDVLQGVILFFVLGSEFFLSYKIAFRKEDTL